MRLEDLVYKYYDKLNQSDLHIWEYISKNRKGSPEMTIEEMAKACNVSRTTILRFAQKISLKGFSELKVYLRWDQEGNESSGSEGDSLEEICRNYHRCIDDAYSHDYSGIFRRIYHADRVFLHGSGTFQQAVAGEAIRMFLETQENFHEVRSGEIAPLLKFITKKDVVILISLSGENETSLDFARKLKLIGVPIISMTKLSSNRLSRLADESLFVNTSYVRNRAMPGNTITAMYFAVMEILAVKYSLFKQELILGQQNVTE